MHGTWRLPAQYNTKMDDSENLLFLSARRLEALEITTDDVISSIEHVIRGCSHQQAWNAPKAVITPPDGRYMMATLSAANDPPFLAVKSLVLNPRNSERGLSDINSLVTLLDSDTGLPLAVLDGNWITAVRTAGLSAVAAKRLARANSSVVAFIGCGVQARSHLQAFASLFPIQEVRVFGRGDQNKDAFCRLAEEFGYVAVACSDARSAVESADLIVSSVTLSRDIVPFIDAGWLKSGVFASVTDLAIPWIDKSMSAFDRIIIDDKKQEDQMPDSLVESALVAGDLTALVNGDVLGRSSDDQKNAFVFRGLALGDLAVAGLAYRRATNQS